MGYYGEDRLLFGTDAPIGILPAGATKEVIKYLGTLSKKARDYCNNTSHKIFI